MLDSDSVANLAIASDIEALLVRDNPRGMALLRQALPPGYLTRAAKLLLAAHDSVAIITGFPVKNTFETDGPAGAMVVYDFLHQRGCSPVVIAEPDVLAAMGYHRRGIAIPSKTAESTDWRLPLREINPTLVISIERPGAANDGHFYNLRGVDISDSLINLESSVSAWNCPVIAIGDGGNELGMGKIAKAVEALDITAAVSSCDELIVADVSNWGAYALVAMAQYLLQTSILDDVDSAALLTQLVHAGAVDGITHEATVTEDGLTADHGRQLIMDIRKRLQQR